MIRRRVEVYCYREDVSKRIERDGDQSRRVTDYKYTSVWLDAKNQIDSTAFKDQNYNLNKKVFFQTESFKTSEDILVDPAGFKVDAKYLTDLTTQKTTKLMDLFPNGGMVEHTSEDGAWYHDADSGYIRCQRIKGKDTIGDIRVSYEVSEEHANGT